MAIPVLIIGRSGSGKTYSLKNFKADEVGVISVEKGRLPFRSDIKVAKVPKDPTKGEARVAAQLNAAKYSWIMRTIQNAKTKSIVIDDSQYLLVNELFDRTYEKGYDKFTSMAQKFRDLIHFINELEDEDKIVYFLHHSELDTDGREKVKTIGKMLDENRYCGDILIQLAAVEKALQSLGYIILQEHMQTCMVEDIEAGRADTVAEVVELIKKLK